VAGSQEDTSGSLAKTNDMRSGRRGQDTILSDEQLLNAVGSANLGNQLNDLGVVVTAIASNDEEGT
jgi:hypothetical protein